MNAISDVNNPEIRKETDSFSEVEVPGARLGV